MIRIRFKQTVPLVAHNQAFRRDGVERLIRMTAREGDEWDVLRVNPWDRKAKTGTGLCTLLLRGNEHSAQPDFIAGVDASMFEVVA